MKKGGNENLLDLKARVKSLKLEMKNSKKAGKIKEWYILSTELKSLKISKKSKIKKPKSRSRSYWVKQLDSIFSQFMRISGADSKGIVRCPLCEWRGHRKEAQNMHFITRSCYLLRWDERNCVAGCYACNVIKKGNYIAYTLYMINKYGKEEVERMCDLKTQLVKITTPELVEKIDHYTRKVVELKEKLGV